jgi:hypothetical protein
MLFGECGGVMSVGEVAADVSALGLKEKLGRALIEPRWRCEAASGSNVGDVDVCWADRGLRFRAFQLSSDGEGSGERAGKTKSGLGRSSM